MAAYTVSFNLLAGSSDPEGDPRTVRRVAGSVVASWPHTIAVAGVALSIEENGRGTATYDDGGDITGHPADGVREPLGSATFTLWDGELESAPQTLTLELLGALTIITEITGPAFDPATAGDALADVTWASGAYADDDGVVASIVSESLTGGSDPLAEADALTLTTVVEAADGTRAAFTATTTVEAFPAPAPYTAAEVAPTPLRALTTDTGDRAELVITSGPDLRGGTLAASQWSADDGATWAELTFPLVATHVLTGLAPDVANTILLRAMTDEGGPSAPYAVGSVTPVTAVPAPEVDAPAGLTLETLTGTEATYRLVPASFTGGVDDITTTLTLDDVDVSGDVAGGVLTVERFEDVEQLLAYTVTANGPGGSATSTATRTVIARTVISVAEAARIDPIDAGTLLADATWMPSVYEASGGETVDPADVAGTLNLSLGGLPMGLAVGIDAIQYQSAAAQEAEFDQYAALGARVFRTDLKWEVIEPTEGAYDWAVPDRMMDLAEARGMTVLFSIMFAPDWAKDADGSPNPAACGDFAAAAATRYGPRALKALQFWNEPNAASFWGANPDPAKYTACLQAVFAAIKAVDPSIRVVAGSPASTSGTGGLPEKMAAIDFVQGIYDAGGRGHFDVMAVHPYTYPFFPSRGPEDWLGWTIAFRETGGNSIRQVMVAEGDGDLPMWITEYGAPTGGSPGDQEVTEAEQAAIIQEAVEFATGYGFVELMLVYSYRDLADRSDSIEGWFGLVRTDGTPKPAWTTFQEKATAAGDPALPLYEGAVVTLTEAVEASDGATAVFPEADQIDVLRPAAEVFAYLGGDPADGAENVAPDAAITLTFTAPPVLHAGVVKLEDAAGATLLRIDDARADSRVTIDGSAVTIAHGLTLPGSAVVTLKIGNTVISDAGGRYITFTDNIVATYTVAPAIRVTREPTLGVPVEGQATDDVLDFGAAERSDTGEEITPTVTAKLDGATIGLADPLTTAGTSLGVRLLWESTGLTSVLRDLGPVTVLASGSGPVPLTEAMVKGLDTNPNIGRTSTAPLKVWGTDAPEPGMEESSANRLFLSGENRTWKDWDLRGKRVFLKGSNLKLLQSLAGETPAKVVDADYITIDPTSSDVLIENVTIRGAGLPYGSNGIKQDILNPRPGGGETTSTGLVVRCCDIADVPADSLKLAGDVLVEWNNLGRHANFPEGTPRYTAGATYSAGDYVLSPNGALLYRSLVNGNTGNPLPTAGSGKSDNTWFQNVDPHCDTANPFAGIGTTIIRYNRFSRDTSRAVGHTGWLRLYRNNARSDKPNLALWGGFEIVGNWVEANTDPARGGLGFNMDLRPENMTGPWTVSHNWMGPTAAGVFHDGGSRDTTDIVFEWDTTNVSSVDGGPVPKPAAATSTTTAYPLVVPPGGGTGGGTPTHGPATSFVVEPTAYPVEVASGGSTVLTITDATTATAAGGFSVATLSAGRYRLTTGGAAAAIKVTEGEATVTPEPPASDKPVYVVSGSGQSELTRMSIQGDPYATDATPYPALRSQTNMTLITARQNSMSGNIEVVPVNDAGIAARKVPPAAAAAANLWDITNPGQHIVYVDLAHQGTSAETMFNDNDSDERPWANTQDVVDRARQWIADNFPGVDPEVDANVWPWWNSNHTRDKTFKTSWAPAILGENWDGSAYSGEIEHHLYSTTAARTADGQPLYDLDRTKLVLTYPGPRIDNIGVPRRNFTHSTDGSKAGFGQIQSHAQGGGPGFAANDGFDSISGRRDMLADPRLAPARGGVGPFLGLIKFGDTPGSGPSLDGGTHPARYSPLGCSQMGVQIMHAALISSGQAFDPNILGVETASDGTWTDVYIGLPNQGVLSTPRKVVTHTSPNPSKADHQQDDGTGFELQLPGDDVSELQPVYRTGTSSGGAAYRAAITARETGTGTGKGRYGVLRFDWNTPVPDGAQLWYQRGGDFSAILTGDDEDRELFLDFPTEYVADWADGSTHGHIGIGVAPQPPVPLMALTRGASTVPATIDNGWRAGGSTGGSGGSSGGGGGGGSTGAPEIASRVPALDATGIDTGTDVSVTWDRAIVLTNNVVKIVRTDTDEELLRIGDPADSPDVTLNSSRTVLTIDAGITLPDDAPIEAVAASSAITSDDGTPIATADKLLARFRTAAAGSGGTTATMDSGTGEITSSGPLPNAATMDSSTGEITA